ncbi:MAG: hypothetical protein U5L06_15725 [Rhodovibrio sp.]|nr:hypothetical protein [Rhodovibrio sp.]
MTHYRWQRRQDPGGAAKAIRQLMALSLDPREEALFRMARITHYGPSQYSQCQDPTGRHATIHAELVPRAAGTVELLYAADATAGLLVFLGVSTTGSSCPAALAEATAAGIT